MSKAKVTFVPSSSSTAQRATSPSPTCSIPGIKANLIATSTIVSSNCEFMIDQKGATLWDKGTNNVLLSTSCSSNNMLEVKLKVLSPDSIHINAAIANKTEPQHKAVATDLELLHHRFGHASEHRLHLLGYNVKGQHLRNCKACILAKQHCPAVSAGPALGHTTKPGEILLADLVRLIKPATRGGASYFLGITDSHTHYSTAILLHGKDNACNAIKAYLCGSPHGVACHIFHSDQGGKFVNKELQTYLRA
jgi:hypothetical protein